MADFAALDELCAWMRSVGATSARMGDVALTLGPPVVSVSSAQPPPSESAEDAERRELAVLLQSSGTDPEVFMRKPRAA